MAMISAASCPSSTVVTPENLHLPSNIFTPSLWGDIFTTFSIDVQVQDKYLEEIEALKQEVKKMLALEANYDMNDKMILIDTLERLGIEYHFKQEIEEQLQCLFNLHFEQSNLFTTALRFRLLRQHRYHASPEVFHKFKGGDNKFKDDIITDAKGLLGLYEAAHLRIQGEVILDEAVAFTTHHLQALVPELESPLRDQVKRALEQPLHRGVPRIEARHYISFYERNSSHSTVLLKLAKLDFNYLQNLYKKELHDLSRWWNSFDLKSKLPYARDRVVECFLWGMAFHFEPQYSSVRQAVAKITQLATVMDDTYDNYATLEEAEIFTEILQKWDIGEINRLPDYMKIVYEFILKAHEEFECAATIAQERSFVFSHLKEATKELGRAYSIELKWFMGRQMPRFEKYFSNTLITGCIFLMYKAAFLGMESATEEVIEWVLSNPKLALASAKMGRYIEDISSHERENKGDQVLTAIDCYMKQYGVSKKEALNKFAELAEDEWKDINKEWLKTASIPHDVAVMSLNYARAAETTYKNFDDGLSNPEKYLAPQLSALFVNPIII